MFRLLFLLFLLGGGGRLYAQYLPTAVEGANWVLINSEINFPYQAYIDRIEGDTLIGGYIYKKMYRYTIDYIEVQTSPPLAPPYDLLPGRDLIAFLRDDTIANSVFGKVLLNQSDLGFSADTLIHDYSLEVGDTLSGYYFRKGEMSLPVTEIGTEGRFGAERRYQKSYDVRFYEGVGSAEYGPLSGGSSFVTNMYSYQLIDYCIGDLPACGLIVSSTDELSESVSLSMFPNPVPSTLNIQLSSSLPSEVAVTLYDLNGRALRQATFRDNLSWELAELPAGIYVAVFTHGGDRVVRRFVKQ